MSARAARVKTSATVRQVGVLLCDSRGFAIHPDPSGKDKAAQSGVPVEIKLSYTDDSYDFCVRECGGTPLGIPAGRRSIGSRSKFK